MSDQETEQNTILAHTGSQMSHFGLAENEFPIVVHPTLLEVPKPKPYENSKRLTYPIEMGKITIFDHYEEFLVKMLTEEMKLENFENFENSENNFQNYNLFLSEPSFRHKLNREKQTQLMFEKFNFNSFCLMPEEILALYETGRTSGLKLLT